MLLQGKKTVLYIPPLKARLREICPEIRGGSLLWAAPEGHSRLFEKLDNLWENTK
jgi:hypothetical protein